TCLAEHVNDHAACDGTPRSWHQFDPLYEAARVNPNVVTVPTERFFCTASTCPSAIGGVVAYFDATHITATYAKTLAPFLEPSLLKAVKGG
ncbi:MAG: acyltransferase, partial [Actinomycetota bacterium]|nr:acyltransferase [Actinomycetota bacterium]